MQHIVLGLLFVIFLSMSQVVKGEGPLQESEKDSSQANRERQDRFRQRLAEQQRILNELLNDETFKQGIGTIRGLFDRLGKQLDSQNFSHGLFDDVENFFQGQGLDHFLAESQLFKKLKSGTGKWIETPSEKILVLKLDVQKDTPVDIKIENEKVSISAVGSRNQNMTDMNGHQRIRQFEYQINQTYNVPEDCNGNAAKFENKNGEIKIRFPKKQSSSVKEKKEIEFNRAPIEHNKNGPVI